VRVGEGRSDSVPGRVCARMPVQEQNGRAGAAVPDAQGDVSDVETVEREPLEHLL
jgi:hypothetical protein